MAYFICYNFDIIDFLGDANLSTNYLEVLKFRAGWCKKILPGPDRESWRAISMIKHRRAADKGLSAACRKSPIMAGASFPGRHLCQSVSWLSWLVGKNPVPHTFVEISYPTIKFFTFRRYIILRDGWRYQSDDFWGKFQTAFDPPTPSFLENHVAYFL